MNIKKRRMRKFAIVALKIFGGVTAFLVALLIALAIAMHTHTVQKKVLNFATELLQKKLKTHVSIDDASMSLYPFCIDLKGVDIEDQQQRKMLQANHIAASIDPIGLFHRHIIVSKAQMESIHAKLYRLEDGTANYQFAIDALKKDKQDKEWDKEHKLSLDISDLTLRDIHIILNIDSLYMVSLAKANLTTRKGKPYLTADSLRLVTNNHQQRKNTGKPHRGFFDLGHIDMTTHIEIYINHLAKDTTNFTLTKCVATDSTTGIRIKDLHFQMATRHDTAYLSHVVVQQENSSLSFDHATIRLPNKKEGKHLEYQTSTITGKALLKDIARPFAPPLAHFSIPLVFHVRLSGTNSSMKFSHVDVHTTNKRLRINAFGNITHLNDKKKLNIQFHVNDMKTDSKTARDIINQFTVKKFMMKQLDNLGTIQYKGDFNILWKRESFMGRLLTNVGEMHVNFTVDGQDKYVSGTIATDSLNLGRAIGMKDLGKMAGQANFRFDISKARTALMRHTKGGKLPIGEASAKVSEVYYNIIKLKNIDTDIMSDGAIAHGTVAQKNRNIDLLCDFSFTDTDSIQSMKVKPHIKLHDLPWQKRKKKKQGKN